MRSSLSLSLDLLRPLFWLHCLCVRALFYKFNGLVCHYVGCRFHRGLPLPGCLRDPLDRVGGDSSECHRCGAAMADLQCTSGKVAKCGKGRYGDNWNPGRRVESWLNLQKMGMTPGRLLLISFHTA